jgi:hypothetical protein
MTSRERLLILIPALYVGAPAFAQTGNRTKMFHVKHFGTIDGNVSLNFSFRPEAEVRSAAAMRQERNSCWRVLSTKELTPTQAARLMPLGSAAFVEPCDGKRNRLAPIRILQSFFMKLRFKFSRSKCRALKDAYVG